MSTQTTLAMLAVALLAANQGALAQGDPPAGPPKELAQLESYEGSWVCHGSAPEGPLGPAHTSTTTVKIHGELDGMSTGYADCGRWTRPDCGS